MHTTNQQHLPPSSLLEANWQSIVFKFWLIKNMLDVGDVGDDPRPIFPLPQAQTTCACAFSWPLYHVFLQHPAGRCMRMCMACMTGNTSSPHPHLPAALLHKWTMARYTHTAVPRDTVTPSVYPRYTSVYHGISRNPRYTVY